ncbi:fused MFS/spermidine synthase [uncultured Pseudoteredinibacter sp.]|uniref:spermidine synthase n=1 Tax=uncultured Pseudoteredinibacter sp. TaxID=1641701 RepID=UPI002638FEFB|nr:fused MFS/spermidine synthase [uncultured Pseudoteredinibacter sp.]
MGNILEQLKSVDATPLFSCLSEAGPLSLRQTEQYRFLEVDGFMQSVMDLQQPTKACLPHAQVINLAQLARPESILMAGLGGGDLLRQFALPIGTKQFTCCEICPDIIEVYQVYFASHSPVDGLQLLQEDINDFIPQCQRQFDLIILDVFAGARQPECLQQESFFQECHSCLSDDGLLVVNVKVEQQSQLLQLALGLRRVFDKKILMVPVQHCDNVIVFAFKGSPFAESNADFVVQLDELNSTLPSPVPLTLGELQACNVQLEGGELELWHIKNNK